MKLKFNLFYHSTYLYINLINLIESLFDFLLDYLNKEELGYFQPL